MFKETERNKKWFILEPGKPPDYRSRAALLQEGGGLCGLLALAPSGAVAMSGLLGPGWALEYVTY